ncbi:MAG: hypothetical protein WBE69_07040, partial [Candidatus Binataceae bacterium]
MSQSTNCHALAANDLLSTLPLEEVEHLFPSLEPVTFELGKVICEPREHLNNVYFPTTSVVSFLYTMADGATAETGLIGNDGMVGVTLILGGETTLNQAVVQIAGRIQDECQVACAGVCARRRFSALPAALHAGTDYADLADCRVQP